MATYSTGVAVSFRSTAITKIVGLSFNYGGGQSEGRSAAFKPVLGQVQITTLSGASAGNWGTAGQLAISGGGMSLTQTVACTDVSATAELNGVTRYSYTFDILG